MFQYRLCHLLALPMVVGLGLTIILSLPMTGSRRDLPPAEMKLLAALSHEGLSIRDGFT